VFFNVIRNILNFIIKILLFSFWCASLIAWKRSLTNILIEIDGNMRSMNKGNFFTLSLAQGSHHENNKNKNVYAVFNNVGSFG
jgi:hypothetical protein